MKHSVFVGGRFPPGLIVVDNSTIKPAAARAIAQKLAEQGVLSLDAPVFGGDIGARNGTLTIMVGGDAAALEEVMPVFLAMGKTVTHVLGHSFGGKVAMAFALERPEPLERVFVIDSHPGIPKVQRGSETSMRVLELLRAAPARFPTRDAFTAFFVERGLDRGVTAWLAMNLAAEGEDFVFRLDLDAIEALLHDYLVTDGFALLEATPPSFEGRVVVVKGGASPTVDAEAEARIRAAAEARPSNVALETIPNAGHWVHVDAPDALLAVIARHLET